MRLTADRLSAPTPLQESRTHLGSSRPLPVRVNFFLDEFANLPPIKDFDHFVTVARGRGIRLLLAIQDLRSTSGDGTTQPEGTRST